MSAGLSRTLPLTVTRPAAIHVSASRREHRPARAITLAMRLPSRTSESVGLVVHAGRVRRRRPDCPERPPVLSPKAPGRHRKSASHRLQKRTKCRKPPAEPLDPMSVAFAEARAAEARAEAPIGGGDRARRRRHRPSGQPLPRACRSDGARGDARRPRSRVGGRLRATRRLRPRRDARALRDVRRRALPRPASAASTTPRPIRKAAPLTTGRGFSATDLPSCARGLRRHPRDRGGDDAARLFRRQAP